MYESGSLFKGSLRSNLNRSLLTCVGACNIVPPSQLTGGLQGTQILVFESRCRLVLALIPAKGSSWNTKAP